MSKTEHNISLFQNTHIAFQDKSNQDLTRAYILFKTINTPIISNILVIGLKLLMYLKIPIKNIIKKTIYKQFCGGTSINKSKKTINKLWKSKIYTILDFSAERKESKKDCDKVMEEVISSIIYANKKNNIPFAVFKPSGLARFSLIEKMNAKNTKFSQKEEVEKTEFIDRIYKICETAYKNKIPIFIDAEESWIQNTADNIILEMMKKFNKKEAIIFNTLQMYRTDRLRYLEEIINQSKKDNFYVGIKLVRGAYLEKEIYRSKRLNYICPVHTKKEDTDRDYNKALSICIKNIKTISLCAGTHNEKSSENLILLMKKHNISTNDKRIFFSQLLGMSDHISYNAAKKGFNVAKYVPYGPIKDMVPYLIRRAQENKSISGQIGRELSNIIQERKRRRL